MHIPCGEETGGAAPGLTAGDGPPSQRLPAGCSALAPPWGAIARWAIFAQLCGPDDHASLRLNERSRRNRHESPCCRRDGKGQTAGDRDVDLEGPRAGEVLVEIKATGICHTDEFTLSGADPEGLFPAILGHEGAGIVVDVGPGVTSVKKGDHVIPLYTPECRQCPSCLSRKTNLCTAIRATQGQGVMPDGTSRFSLDGRKIHHYMGCSTFANFTVLPEIAVAKIREDAPFDKVCYIGCGVTTGIGAVINTAKVEPGAKCIVFGLGGIGLNVIQGLRLAGADMIIGVDINNARKEWGERFGMTHFVNPKEVGGDLVPHLVNMTKLARTRSAAPTTPSTAPAMSR